MAIPPDEGTLSYYAHYSGNKIHHSDEKIPLSMKLMILACAIFLIMKYAS